VPLVCSTSTRFLFSKIRRFSMGAFDVFVNSCGFGDTELRTLLIQ
jgi:hypothetical protein